MISNLSELVAPLDVAAFRALLRQRSPTLLRGAGVGRYGSLLDWQGLMDVVFSGHYPAKKVRLRQHGNALPGLFFRAGENIKADLVKRLMEGGGSLLAYGIDSYVPALSRLCTAICGQIGEHVVAGAVATTGTGGALDIHYDDSDIVALQMEGSKRWFIERDPVIDPVAGMVTVAGNAEAEILMDVVLEQGDLLFVPAGYRHRCETQGARSLHLTFSFYPLTMPRSLDLLMRRMMDDVVSRKPMRSDDLNAREVEAILKRGLVEWIEKLSLAELVA